MDKKSVVDPVISVCIANYNGIDVIGPCVESVLCQKFSQQIEIIIHDDASTDDSVRYIKDHFPRVKLLVSKQNVGFCVSNNKMAAIAQGQYLLFLNNDTELFPNALASLFDHANKSGRSEILGLPQYDMETNKLIDIGSKFDLFLNPVPNTDPKIKKVGMVIGACLWIPKSLWNKIGGFPEWYSTLSEDLYVCLVAHIWGYSSNIVTDSGFKHWVGHSLGGGKVKKGKLATTFKRRRLSERNKTYTMLLCYPLLLLIAVLPLHLLYLFVEGMLLVALKQDINIWRNIYAPTFHDCWKLKSHLTQERKKAQQYYSVKFKDFISIFVWYPYKLKMVIKHGLPNIK